MLQPQGKNGRLLAQRNAQTDGFVRFIAPRFLSQEATFATPLWHHHGQRVLSNRETDRGRSNRLAVYMNVQVLLGRDF